MPDAQDTAETTGEQPSSEKTVEESVAEQEYLDRDKLDFDPDDGLYTGTAVHGGTKIPGPHDQVDDVEPGDEEEESIADE